MNHPRFTHYFCFLLPALFLTGCVDLTGRPPTQFTPTRSGTAPGFARAGHVYCMLGWLGIWSRSMDVVAQRVNSELDVHAISVSNPEWRKSAAYVEREWKAGRWSGPLVLVGHSIGCDDQIRVAKLLNAKGIPIDLMILLEANAPPAIPPNVRRCVNIYKSKPVLDAVPVFRGAKVHASDPGRTRVENIDLRHTNVGFDTGSLNHFNIAKNKQIQDMVLAEIAKTCPRKSH